MTARANAHKNSQWSMAGSAPGWVIREEDSYDRCVAKLGGARKIDRALELLIGQLGGNPRHFPLAGHDTIRLARTRIVMVGKEIIPALSLRFRVEQPNVVCLLHLEIALPEEIGFGDGWPWS